MRNLAWVFCFVMAASLLTSCASSAAETSPDMQREAQIEAAFEEIEASGLSVIVAIGSTGNPEQIIAEFGAFTQDDIPAADTQHDILSLTKMVTAVAVLDLVEEGKLSLDETLGDIFPGVPADKAEITVHQLLIHSAGFGVVSGDDYEVISQAEFLDRVFTTRLWNAPGQTHSYSNPGYTVLTAIVEERSGQSFEAFVRDTLAAADLSSFGYEAVYDPASSARSRRGEPISDASWGGPEPSWNLIGGGGMIATASDFLKFRHALANGDILSEDSVELALTPHIREYQNRDSFYGYGIVVEQDPDYGVIYTHNGGSRFFSSMWVEYPATGDVFFVAGPNMDAGYAFRAMRILQKHLYPKVPQE